MTDDEVRKKQRLTRAAHDILAALGPLTAVERMRLLATFAIDAGQYKAAKVAIDCLIAEEASESEGKEP